MTVDGWMTISKDHVDAVLVELMEMSCQFKLEAGGSSHTGVEFARKLIFWMAEVEDKVKCFICSVCTDNAEQCVKGRRIVAYYMSWIIVFPCFGHQVSCCFFLIASIMNTIW